MIYYGMYNTQEDFYNVIFNSEVGKEGCYEEKVLLFIKDTIGMLPNVFAMQMSDMF